MLIPIDRQMANRSLGLAIFTSQFLRLWLCFCKLIMLRFLSSYFTEVHKWILRKYFLILSFKLMSPFPNPLSAELPMDKLTAELQTDLHFMILLLKQSPYFISLHVAEISYPQASLKAGFSPLCHVIWQTTWQFTSLNEQFEITLKITKCSPLCEESVSWTKLL